ncbi:hypothetical protein [uncultured Maribacter sp.]|uniref:hypothetical protein n=1 Tax=uncultured Maribacter sp. TaxID=431308 RepID=UPI002601956C|nr:hypothetical protein [uncultured Maribacter sp.]
MDKNNIIISEGNRPLWQLVIAAIHYTAIVTLLIFYFTDFDFTLKTSIHTFELIILILPSAIAFSVVKNVLFDLNNRKYKQQYCVGPIKYGKWKNLPEIEYVSVFKQPLVNGDFVFETNLWHSTNQHFNIFESEIKDPVFLLGKNIAKVLKVDLLDATIPNNYKWIEIEN